MQVGVMESRQEDVVKCSGIPAVLYPVTSKREGESSVTNPQFTRHASFDYAAAFSCFAKTASVKCDWFSHPASPPPHQKNKKKKT